MGGIALVEGEITAAVVSQVAAEWWVAHIWSGLWVILFFWFAKYFMKNEPLRVWSFRRILAPPWHLFCSRFEILCSTASLILDPSQFLRKG